MEHGIFGYATPPQELVQVVVARMREKYRWEIDPSWIVWLPGVVPALNVVCRAYGQDGDEVVTFTPVYPPFLMAPPRCGKTLRTIPLRREGDLYTFDAEKFEREISTRSRILLLCNPHNPVGRRYDRGEIERIARICVAHDLLVCSDEIHCELILEGGPHIPTATLGPEVSARTITLMAPSKTFNIPGLNCAFAIIENPGVADEIQEDAGGHCARHERDGASQPVWRPIERASPGELALIDYLRGNRDLVRRFVREEAPGSRWTKSRRLIWPGLIRDGSACPTRRVSSSSSASRCMTAGSFRGKALCG